MSVKVIDLATSKKKNENVQKKILQREKETKKHVFQSSSKPESPSLSDKSEFPSLSESLGRVSNYLPSSGSSLKYSDKLKSSSSSRNHAPVFENVHFKSNTSSTDAHQCDDKMNRSNFSSANSRNKLYDNSKTKNIAGKALNHSLNKSISSDNEVNHLEKKEWTKQKPVLKSKRESQSMAIKSPVCQSSDANMLIKSSKQSNKPETVKNKESKEENAAAQDSSKAKKKKARKSKIKRQVAMQSGKITFLTPEIHSKILNQASLLNTQNSVNSPVVGNINDEEEYPELGKAVLPMSQKENALKRNVPTECQVEDLDKSADYSVEKMDISGNIVAESPKIAAVEKKEKADKVHSHNPITISFYEMLLEKNAIKKETKELDSKTETPNVIGLSKLKNKKNVSHSLNLLDSSSPAVKRGKERENPKPKKPSQLKKIILLDRKARREHLLQMKNSSEGEIAESGLISKQHGEENNLLTSEKEDEDDVACEDDYLFFQEEVDENDEIVSQLTESRDFCMQNELTSRMTQLNISGETNNYKATSDLSSDFIEVVGKSTLASDKKSRAENDSSMRSLTISQPDVDPRMHLNIPLSPESLLNTLTGMTCPDISDKERAVKILLHTRNFREYCNHLISKDIDDATYALLDDLARFQDRLHQKDPVKARMKRRMIYGVKEVKKHIKLRKLKCIIIAVDIENVETQGGLNDILNEIKVSAVDHHIPYVFALSRKVLGKVCRKPVPVSCVGVFNYEGSEANFKKMVELQSQSKADYAEIFNKLLVKITDEEVAALIKAKKEAPETLRAVRANILSDFFLPFDSVKSENNNNDLKSADDTSQLIPT